MTTGRNAPRVKKTFRCFEKQHVCYITWLHKSDALRGICSAQEICHISRHVAACARTRPKHDQMSKHPDSCWVFFLTSSDHFPFMLRCLSALVCSVASRLKGGSDDFRGSVVEFPPVSVDEEDETLSFHFRLLLSQKLCSFNSKQLQRSPRSNSSAQHGLCDPSTSRLKSLVLDQRLCVLINVFITERCPAAACLFFLNKFTSKCIKNRVN